MPSLRHEPVEDRPTATCVERRRANHDDPPVRQTGEQSDMVREKLRQSLAGPVYDQIHEARGAGLRNDADRQLVDEVPSSRWLDTAVWREHPARQVSERDLKLT